MLDKYTNLPGDYIDSKALEYAGLKKVDKVQQAEPMAPVQCPKCHTVNEPGNKHCHECGRALTKDGEDELSMIRDGMTPEEWISFWQWKKYHIVARFIAPPNLCRHRMFLVPSYPVSQNYYHS